MLRVYARMLPRLEAERFLEQIDALAVTSGRMGRADVQRLLAAKQRQAHGAAARRAGERRLRTVADWMAMPGVRVTQTPKG